MSLMMIHNWDIVITHNGEVIQKLDYLPFGELWYDKRYDTNWEAPYTFSGKERDAETGLSYFGARYYDSEAGIWISVDPLLDKYLSFSPYVYCANNPIKFVDPDGRENIYALTYARKKMLNKIEPIEDGNISLNSWYNSPLTNRYTLTSQVPDYASCYEAIWHAYMNSGERIQFYLQEGFSNSSNAFIGRNKGIEWFKAGNDLPSNVDGMSRSFETDIMKGELGDIIFMDGHAAILAGIPELVEKDGDIFVKLKMYTTTTNIGFIEQDVLFNSETKKNQTRGWSGFQGYGQMHGTEGKGDPNLLPKPIE